MPHKNRKMATRQNTTQVKDDIIMTKPGRVNKKKKKQKKQKKNKISK